MLLLDELPEFPRSVLESLRKPIKNGFVAVAQSVARGTPRPSGSSARSTFTDADLMFAPIPVAVS